VRDAVAQIPSRNVVNGGFLPPNGRDVSFLVTKWGATQSELRQGFHLTAIIPERFSHEPE